MKLKPKNSMLVFLGSLLIGSIALKITRPFICNYRKTVALFTFPNTMAIQRKGVRPISLNYFDQFWDERLNHLKNAIESEKGEKNV